MDKKEQTRLRVERYRERQKALQNDTESVTHNVTQRLVFADDSSVLDLGVLEKKREALTKITDYMDSVDKFRPLLKEIRFGVAGCTLDRIKVVLDVIPT